MSILNDIDRDFSNLFDNTPYYGGCAKTLKYTHRHIPEILRTQQESRVDKTESWNLYVTLSKWVVPRLENMRPEIHGYPCGLTEEEWDNVLVQMIKGFKLIAEDDFLVPGSEDLRDAWFAVDLFAKYFFDLWD